MADDKKNLTITKDIILVNRTNSVGETSFLNGSGQSVTLGGTATLIIGGSNSSSPGSNTTQPTSSTAANVSSSQPTSSVSMARFFGSSARGGRVNVHPGATIIAPENFLNADAEKGNRVDKTPGSPK